MNPTDGDVLSSASASIGSSSVDRAAKVGGKDGGVVVAASIPPVAVSAFCCANARCRNFLKGVGTSGSADLVLVS